MGSCKNDPFVPPHSIKESFFTQSSGRVLNMPSRVVEGDTVSLHFVGKLMNGIVVFSSEMHGPSTFIQGQGENFPMVHKALLGMAIGESKTVCLSSDEAFGPYYPKLTIEVHRTQFEAQGISPTIGLDLKVGQDHEEPLPVRVTAITGSSVTLDANHPLAGHSITLDLLLVNIQHNPREQPEENCRFDFRKP